MPRKPVNEPTPTEPVELEDGSLEWPTDPNFVPTPHPEQDLTPRPESSDPDYGQPEPGTDPAWEDLVEDA